MATKLTVLGAGAWGTVLAQLLANNGHNIRLWTRTSSQAEDINQKHINTTYMPNLKLSETIIAMHNLQKAITETQAVIWAIPTKSIHAVMQELPNTPAFVSCSKGLEQGSFATVTDILHSYQPQAIQSALSGPNLAREIANLQPAAATIASKQQDFAKEAQTWFSQARFRVYTSSDLRGLEIAGATKNVIALAAGMSDGLGLGDNAKASLLTRGLAEMIRLGTHLGGQKETFYGLAGLGDMIATCSSSNSRNYSVGRHFAQGKTLAEIQALKLTAEGLTSVQAIHQLATQSQLDLPISAEIFSVIYENKAPKEALSALMQREPKAE